MTGCAYERLLKMKKPLKREDAKELAPLGIIMKKLFSKQ